MKKLVSASIVLACACSSMVICLPGYAQGPDGQSTPDPAAQNQGAPGASANCAAPTIKDAAEYNAYTNATSQSTPAAKASAMEQFLTQYPNSVAKNDVLQELMVAYQQSGNAQKTLDTAKRLLQADANNLRALLVAVYLEKQLANGDQAKLDEAAADAQKGLNAQKDPCTSQADYDKVKDTATPIFYSAIGADDAAKKDYKGEIDAFTKELQSYKDPAQTTQIPGLLDTYYLGNAYVSADPKDPNNQKQAVWFLTRAAQFAKPPYQQQIETAAEYWYKKYHCAQNDAACQSTPPQGFQQVQQLAAIPANVFPPATYNPSQAPPPPSPQDLAHQAIVTTQGCANATPAPPPAPANGAAPAAAPAATPAPASTDAAAASIPPACSDNLKGMALGDKEFILANGAMPDQQAIWGVMKGVTAEVPGTIISATSDSVQLAVSQDAQQSQKADFTVNMKTPLKELPKTGDKVTYIATFDSYTQNPPMIILKDGEPKTPERKAAPHRPARHTTH